MRVPVSVVVLTHNEEQNMPACLEAVHHWADEVFVVDSGSDDKTVDIAAHYKARVCKNEFRGYSEQRNWALDNLPFTNEWVLFLDADEVPSPALKKEMARSIAVVPEQLNGFYVKRRFIFMGRWIKHGGYYPTWLLRLFRHKFGRCENRRVDEHFTVCGETAALKNDLIHEDRKGITFWVERHNRYATLEALAQMHETDSTNRRPGDPAVRGQADRKRFIRRKVWSHLPPLVRPWLYFFYRYVLRVGFLDGRPGFIYHLMHAFWFRFLVDVKIEEYKMHASRVVAPSTL
jgi:glycosyltransferase involved in cell wall biosynthesis